MELVDQFSSGLIAALAVFVVHFLSRGRFVGIDKQLGALRNEIEKVRAESREQNETLNWRLDTMRSEMNTRLEGMRSDITRIALAVGAQPRPNAG